MNASKQLPLSLQHNLNVATGNSQEGEEEPVQNNDYQLPSGKQFYLTAPYQRNKKQVLALIVAPILFFTSAILCAILIIPNEYKYIYILLIIVWLISLLLIPYGFGVFDRSEQWLSYLLIINKKNKIYLIKESTHNQYIITDAMQNISINDINIIPDDNDKHSSFIKICNTLFNKYAVSNKDISIFIEEVANYLNGIKQKRKAVSHSLGCDICSFNIWSYIFMMWSYIFMMWYISSGLILIITPASRLYDDYCSSQVSEYYSNGSDCECHYSVKHLLDIWRIVWSIGIILSIVGIIGLYRLSKGCLIGVIVYSAIRLIFWQIVLGKIWDSTKFGFHVVALVLHIIQFIVLVVTFFKIRSAITVSQLQIKLHEMNQISIANNEQTTSGIQLAPIQSN